VNRDLRAGRPGSTPLYIKALRVGQSCSSPTLQAPETVNAVNIEVGWIGNGLVPGHFSDTSARYCQVDDQSPGAADGFARLFGLILAPFAVRRRAARGDLRS
jgi:hypothetical protein